MEEREAQPLKCDSGWDPGGHGYVVDGCVGCHYSSAVAVVLSNGLDQYGLDRAVGNAPEVVWVAVDGCLVYGGGGECLGSVHDESVHELSRSSSVVGVQKAVLVGVVVDLHCEESVAYEDSGS